MAGLPARTVGLFLSPVVLISTSCRAFRFAEILTDKCKPPVVCWRTDQLPTALLQVDMSRPKVASADRLPKSSAQPSPQAAVIFDWPDHEAGS